MEPTTAETLPPTDAKPVKPKTAAQLAKAERAAKIKQANKDRVASIAAKKAEAKIEREAKAAAKANAPVKPEKPKLDKAEKAELFKKTQAAVREAKKVKREAKEKAEVTPKGPTPAQAARTAELEKRKQEKTEADAAKVAKKQEVATIEQAKAAAISNDLDPLANEINVRFAKAAKLESDADDHRLAASIQLASAKAKCAEHGLKFKDWAEKNITEQSYENVRKLVAVGSSENPRLALADLREKNALANAAHREKKKVPTTREVIGGTEEGGAKAYEDNTAEDFGFKQPKPAKPAMLHGVEALKAAFGLLKATDKMLFAHWAAEEVGGELHTTFDDDTEAGSAAAQAQFLNHHQHAAE
jgi:hypothetical protein